MTFNLAKWRDEQREVTRQAKQGYKLLSDYPHKEILLAEQKLEALEDLLLSLQGQIDTLNGFVKHMAECVHPFFEIRMTPIQARTYLAFRTMRQFVKFIEKVKLSSAVGYYRKRDLDNAVLSIWRVDKTWEKYSRHFENQPRFRHLLDMD